MTGARDSAPEPIRADHVVTAFRCGQPALDAWLRTRALGNEARASRSFVIADPAQVVVAYYALATGSVMLADLPRAYRRNLPDPVPVVLLGRLAVDKTCRGTGLGAALLADALARTMLIAREAGVRALIVHAIDDAATTFYEKYGFRMLMTGTRSLFLPIESIAAAL